MKKILSGVLLISTLFLFACNDKNKDIDVQPSTALSFLHAAYGVGEVDLSLNGEEVTQGTDRPIVFGDFVGINLKPLTYKIDFFSRETGDKLTSVQDSLSEGNYYTAILYDTGSAVKSAIIKEQFGDISSNDAPFLRFLNLSPDPGAVTVYVDKQPFFSGRSFADFVSNPGGAIYKQVTGGEGNYDIVALNAEGDTLDHKTAVLQSMSAYTIFLAGSKDAPVDSLKPEMFMKQTF